MAHSKRLISKANELRRSGLSWTRVAEAVNEEFADEMRRATSGDSLRKTCERDALLSAARTTGTVSPHMATADTADRIAEVLRHSKRNPEKMSYAEWMETFAAAGEISEQTSIRELEVDVEVRTETPIAVVFSSDWHLGNKATNHRRITADMDIVRRDERIYLCVGGDPIDNFPVNFRDASAVVNAVASPQEQRLGMESILRELEPSILAMIGGNHNNMPTRITGEDPNYYILRNMKFSYMPHGGLLKLTVGDVLYKVLWKHTYRFKSSLNEFNSHHRMSQMLVPDSDINVQEHVHSPGVEMIEVGEHGSQRTQVNIKTGTYKGDDSYSMDYYKAGRIGPQVVILWPDKKKCGPVFHGVDAVIDAQLYLDGMKHTKGRSAKGKVA